MNQVEQQEDLSQLSMEELQRRIEEMDRQIRELSASRMTPAEPEDMTLGQAIEVMQDGTQIASIPSAAQKIRSAGYTILWNRRDRTPSVVMAERKQWYLDRTFPNDRHYYGDWANQRVYTEQRPTEPPFRGKSPCYLHETSKHRPLADEFNFPSCPQGALLDDSQVQQHMKKTHRAEWAIIQNHLTEAKEARTEERWEAILDRLASRDMEVVNCEECGEAFEGKNKFGANARLRSHMTRQHRTESS